MLFRSQSFAVGIVELHAAPSPYTVEVGQQPEASKVARLQAARGPQVTNLRHENVTLTEEARQLLTLLDGTRTHDALVSIVSSREAPARAQDRLRTALAQLARQALLMRAE